jgi:hypothetical protein
VTSRVATAVGDFAERADIGTLAIKGLSRSLAVANVVALKQQLARGAWGGNFPPT